MYEVDISEREIFLHPYVEEYESLLKKLYKLITLEENVIICSISPLFILRREETNLFTTVILISALGKQYIII